MSLNLRLASLRVYKGYGLREYYYRKKINSEFHCFDGYSGIKVEVATRKEKLMSSTFSDKL